MGEISDPIDTPRGFLIVKLTGREGGGFREFADVARDIRNELYAEKSRDVQERLYEQLRGDLEIQLNEAAVAAIELRQDQLGSGPPSFPLAMGGKTKAEQEQQDVRSMPSPPSRPN